MFTFLSSPAPHPEVSPRLRQAGILLILFLCLFIPFRTPLADNTLSAVKAIPDLLIIALFVWYSVSIRLRYRFTLPDLLFIAFELLALISTVFVNRLGLGLFIYQTRSIGIYYILFFVVRNFGYGQREFCMFTRTLQAVSVPVFLLALVEKIFCKTVLFNPAFAATLDKINFGRLYSTFYNPNTYGLFLVFVVLLSLFMAYFYGKKTHPLMYFSLFAALYMTMSRSSMMILGACMVLVLIVFVKKHGKKFPWLRVAISAACIAVGVALMTAAVTYVSNRYFDAKGQYIIMERIFPNLKAETTTVKYLTPDGEERTGYVYNGATYLDKTLTKPLSECGSIVFVDDKEYILTTEGGKLLQEFLALPADRQSALTGGNIDRMDIIRDNSYLENIKSSLGVAAGDRFSELGTDALYSQNTNMRIQSVLTALKVARDQPLFGSGYGTYGSSASLTWEVPNYKDLGLYNGFYADNQYACVVAETGFVGLGLFMAFLLTTLWKYRNNLLCLLACLIIGWFGIFYNILEIQIGAMLLWSLLSFDLPELTLKDLFGKKKNG
jgi:hypothetical protein